MTLYETVLEKKVPAEDIDNHESDLYLRATSTTRSIMQEFLKKNKNPPQSRFTWSTFTDERGSPWYEIPFAYIPFWKERGVCAEGILC